jgi:hypothetical protein
MCDHAVMPPRMETRLKQVKELEKRGREGSIRGPTVGDASVGKCIYTGKRGFIDLSCE